MTGRNPPLYCTLTLLIAPAELGRIPISKHQIQPVYGDEQADAERTTAKTVSRDQILRRKRGQGNIYFPCSADHEQDWQNLTRLIHNLVTFDHTLIAIQGNRNRGKKKKTFCHIGSRMVVSTIILSNY